MTRNVLRYSKKLFTRAQVLSSKRAFRFPRAWKLSSTKKDWVLRFDEKTAERLYFTKRKWA